MSSPAIRHVGGHPPREVPVRSMPAGTGESNHYRLKGPLGQLSTEVPLLSGSAEEGEKPGVEVNGVDDASGVLDC